LTFTVATWNCADGFARKFPWLKDLNADFIAVQEVRQKAFDQVAPLYRHAFYLPSKTARGVAIFSNLDVPFQPLPMRLRKSDRCYLAVTVSMPSGDVDILNAWVKPVEDYVRPSHRALRAFFRASKAPFKIVLGDLNQNRVLDKRRKLGLFTDTIKIMRKNKMVSAYHQMANEEFGAETRPTHFLTYSSARLYHLDYIFTSVAFEIQSCEVFPEQPWFTDRRSDHLPMRAVIENETPNRAIIRKPPIC